MSDKVLNTQSISTTSHNLHSTTQINRGSTLNPLPKTTSTTTYSVPQLDLPKDPPQKVINIAFKKK